MAMRKINAMLEAVSLGKEKDRAKNVEGYLISARFGVGKSKKNKGQVLYRLQKTNAEQIEVWGNASLNNALTLDGKKLRDELVGYYVKAVFVRQGKAKKGQSAPNICDVFVDDAKRQKSAGGKTYQLNK